MTSQRADWWIPFHARDYLQDTTRLNRDQHGAYFLLLLDYWINGPLPDNDDQLAVIVKASTAEWRRSLRPTVLHPFFHIVEGAWHQKRMDAEIAKAEAIYEQRKAASIAAVEARRGKKIFPLRRRGRSDDDTER